MKLTLFSLLLSSSIGFCANFTPQSLPDAYANLLANSIYQLEGGGKTKYPYGIKSIDTGGNAEKARRICLNTIKNNYIRWQKDGCKGRFMDYLANRYCPPSADKQGNINWKNNIRKLSGIEF